MVFGGKIQSGHNPHGVCSSAALCIDRFNYLLVGCLISYVDSTWQSASDMASSFLVPWLASLYASPCTFFSKWLSFGTTSIFGAVKGKTLFPPDPFMSPSVPQYVQVFWSLGRDFF